MRDLTELGIVRHSEVTPEVIEAVESALGVALPTSYKDFVSYADEAQPEVGVFSYGDWETCISEFLKFTDDASDVRGVIWNSNRVAGLPHSVIPIARDAGDLLVCLDLRDGASSVVVYDPVRAQTIFVAQNFESFIEGLRE